VSDAANLLELVLAQSDLRALDVLFQVLDRRGARDGQGRWGAMQQPGQGNLAGSRMVSPGNLVQDTAWTCQFADPLRIPGEKADALACAQVDHFLFLPARIASRNVQAGGKGHQARVSHDRPLV
jgi:hypothetical protein